MNANIRLGRIGGVPVGLHWSWFIVFFLVTGSLSMGYFVIEDTLLNPTLNWVLGISTSLLFFLSVLIHELGHAVVAIRAGIPVRNIVLFIFGGMATITEEPSSARTEFKIAIAGPLASLLLAVFFGLISLIFADIPFLGISAKWLGLVNLALAGFNMLPGFPLDGGRVFRAILWAITKNFQQATRVASISGQIVAFGFIGFGIFTLFGGNLVNGLWLAFIGWFLQNAALASRQHTDQQHVLDTFKVSQVMSHDLESVPGKLSITKLVEEKFLPSGKHLFLIAENGQPKGMISLHEVTVIPRMEWDTTAIEQVMTPWDKLVQVQADMALGLAIDAMDFAKASLAPVVEEGQIAGLLSREQIARYVR
ncbi:MAG TPA: site-2 protease family protein [Anaerolineaceae bacterium]|nr:site-2 protease family protein [Anaerolineaceae bacterium]